MASRVGGVRPEQQAVLLCARPRLDTSAAEQLREIVQQAVNWPFLLAFAAENSLSPLVYVRLKANCADHVPPHVLDELARRYRQNAIRSLYLCAELEKILQRFRHAGLFAIPYKGPVLAAQAYGDAALREFDDLDILICQRDARAAHSVMVSLGYHPRFSSVYLEARANGRIPGEYVFFHEGGRSLVELHTERTLRHFPLSPALEEFRSHLQTVRLNGGPIETFSREDLLPFLCVHGSKDFWARLAWIADVAWLLEAQRWISWELVRSSTRSLGAGRMVDLGLRLAGDLLGARLPNEIFELASKSAAVVSLAREICASLFGEPRSWTGLAGRSFYRIRMCERWTQGIGYWLRLSVGPPEEEWSVPRFPKPLLRPIRLLHRYARGGLRGD